MGRKKKKRTLILRVCFKGRMMEKICFGLINNCQKRGKVYCPRVICAERININLTLA